MVTRVVRRHAQGFAPILAALVLGCASSHEPLAPFPGTATEQLEVQVTHRDLAPGERAQWVRILPGRGVVTVDVVRPAFCATIVTAAANRTPSANDVIASVGGNPAADCIPIPRSHVVAYRVTVPQVQAGRVTVRLFEMVGDQPPSLRGRANVSVDP